jgi:hypothetical protein
MDSARNRAVGRDVSDAAKYVSKPRRFNRLQSALDKLVKTKGRNKKDVKNEDSSG